MRVAQRGLELVVWTVAAVHIALFIFGFLNIHSTIEEQQYFSFKSIIFPILANYRFKPWLVEL